MPTQGAQLVAEDYKCANGTDSFEASPFGSKCKLCQKDKKVHTHIEAEYEVIPDEVWDGCDAFGKAPFGKLCTNCQKHEKKHSPEARGVPREDGSPTPAAVVVDYVDCDEWEASPFGNKCKNCQKAKSKHRPELLGAAGGEAVAELTMEEKRAKASAEAAARAEAKRDAAKAAKDKQDEADAIQAEKDAKAAKLARLAAKLAG